MSENTPPSHFFFLNFDFLRFVVERRVSLNNGNCRHYIGTFIHHCRFLPDSILCDATVCRLEVAGKLQVVYIFFGFFAVYRHKWTTKGVRDARQPNIEIHR